MVSFFLAIYNGWKAWLQFNIKPVCYMICSCYNCGLIFLNVKLIKTVFFMGDA